MSANGKDHISGSSVSQGGAEGLYFPVQLEVDTGTRWARTHVLLLMVIPRSVRSLLSTTEWVQTVHALSLEDNPIQ